MTMIALVRGVIAAAISSGSILNVSGSMSTNTGLAKRWVTHVAVEANVKLGSMTSSPGCRSMVIMARSSAEVQEVTSSTRGTPRRSCSTFSNSRHCRPSPPICPARITAVTAAMSSSVIHGLHNGR